jgi:hypothetical protein
MVEFVEYRKAYWQDSQGVNHSRDVPVYFLDRIEELERQLAEAKDSANEARKDRALSRIFSGTRES